MGGAAMGGAPVGAATVGSAAVGGRSAPPPSPALVPSNSSGRGEIGRLGLANPNTLTLYWRLLTAGANNSPAIEDALEFVTPGAVVPGPGHRPVPSRSLAVR